MLYVAFDEEPCAQQSLYICYLALKKYLSTKKSGSLPNY